MNTGFHVTTGSYFVGKGIVTEAGRRPARMPGGAPRRCHGHGFKPLVYGNVKGFYDPNPTEESSVLVPKAGDQFGDGDRGHRRDEIAV